MTDTTMTTTTTQVGEHGGSTFQVPGWERPAWAVDARLENGMVVSTRAASVFPLVPVGADETPTPARVELNRFDMIRLDAQAGTMSIEQGPAMISFDIEEVPVSEARKLAAALVELADAAEIVPED